MRVQRTKSIRVTKEFQKKANQPKGLSLTAQVNVKSTFEEGDSVILQLYCMKKREIFGWLLSILLGLSTFGITWLMEFWRPKFRRFLRYSFVSTVGDATHFFVLEWDNQWEVIRKEMIDFMENGQMTRKVSIVNRNLRYIYDELNMCFTAFTFPCEIIYNDLHSNVSEKNGLDPSEVVSAQKLFGSCLVNVPVPSISFLFWKNFLKPFFLFQLYAVVWWINFDYGPFAIALLFLTLSSLMFEVYLTRKNSLDIKKLAEANLEVQVIRRNEKGEREKMTINSEFLVPGDLIVLESINKVPCDSVILKGKVIVDESSMTGEGVPVLKKALPKSDKFSYSAERDKLFTLYEATKLLQAFNPSEREEALGLVIRTSYSTIRGQIIRAILYPKKSKFKFRSESYKFLIVIGVFTIISYGVWLLYKIKTSGDMETDPLTIFGFSTNIKINHAIIMLLELGTISVPPTLFAAFNISNIISILRLKAKGISCIDLSKIGVAGRIDHVVVDKTGTLTEDGMTVMCYLSAENGVFKDEVQSKSQVSKLRRQTYSDSTFKAALRVMGTCHSVVKVKERIFGDSMEINIFEFSGTKHCQESSDQEATNFRFQVGGLPTQEVLSKFEFDPQTQCMTVLVKQEKNLYANSKGSPEAIKCLCTNDSLPSDYDKVVRVYAEKGYRVLALAYKTVACGDKEEEKKNMESILKEISEGYELDREDYEKNLEFLGFVILANKCKKESAETIGLLKEAGIQVKMCTGDNPITALNVAKECNFVFKEQSAIVVDMEKPGTLAAKISIQALTANSGANPSAKSDKKGPGSKPFGDRDKSEKKSQGNIALKVRMYADKDGSSGHALEVGRSASNDQEEGPCTLVAPDIHPEFHKAIIGVFEREDIKKKALVFTGRAFDFLFEASIQKQSIQKKIMVLSYLRRASVYARMTPSQKAKLIELLQFLGHSCTMIGDGANDCCALKAADIGLALSLREFSISAPFATECKNIKPIELLLREGRCTLSTNYQCFKFLIL